MKLKKEIQTKTYREDTILVETVKQYHYDSAEERASHLIEMERNGYQDSGQVQDNIGSFMKPKYVWFGSYYKIETKQIK